MSTKNGKWIILGLIVLAALYYWKHKVSVNATNPVAASHSVVEPSKENKISQNIVTQETAAMPQVQNPFKATSNPTIPSNTPNSTTSLNAPVPLQADNGLTQGQKQNVGTIQNPIVVVNPTPTDEEAMAAIKLANQKLQAMNKIIEDRKEKIKEVHELVMAQDNSQVKIFVAPLTQPPADIADKIRTHQLTAH